MNEGKEDLKRQKEMAVERIVFIRHVLGITQAGLAGMTGFSLSYVKKIEVGSRALSLPFLRAFCLALGVSADWVLYGRPEPPEGL